jgi:hypothetical protein
MHRFEDTYTDLRIATYISEDFLTENGNIKVAPSQPELPNPSNISKWA